MKRHIAIASVTAVLCAACGRSSPTAPTPGGTSTVAGAWHGTVTGGGTVRTVRLVLEAYLATSSGALLAGRYESSSLEGDDGGTVGGAVTDTRVSLLLTPSSAPTCPTAIPFTPGLVALQLTFDGTRLSGQGTVTLCPASERVDAVFTRP